MKHATPENEFARALLKGLSDSPKTAEAKWFYDAAGSALFERITELPEYYPTRTEIGILRDRLPEIGAHVPAGAALIEFGSGASVKTRVLLDGLDQLAAYVPIDISAQFLAETAIWTGTRQWPFWRRRGTGRMRRGSSSALIW